MATKITSIKKTDKITALSHLAGTFNLAAGAILTIGGLQYTTDAVKSVALASISYVGTTRYQIYAVISSGDVILVISTNENSVGPAGYSSWKLVGCFYTDGLSSPSFGSFVNIKGIPKTVDKIPYLGLIVDQNNTDVRSPSPFTQSYFWERLGKRAFYTGGYYHQGTVGTNGSNAYYVRTPPNQTLINNNIPGAGNTPSGGGIFQGDVGGGLFMTGSRGQVANVASGFLFNGFACKGLSIVPGGTVDGGQWAPSGAGGSIDGFAMNVAFMGMTWSQIPVEVTEFSDTPIEDL